jgi:hypothetical protein
MMPTLGTTSGSSPAGRGVTAPGAVRVASSQGNAASGRSDVSQENEKIVSTKRGPGGRRGSTPWRSGAAAALSLDSSSPWWRSVAD